VPVTEVRAGIIVGPASAACEVMRDLDYHLPLTGTPTWVQTKSSPNALSKLDVDPARGDRLARGRARVHPRPPRPPWTCALATASVKGMTRAVVRRAEAIERKPA